MSKTGPGDPEIETVKIEEPSGVQTDKKTKPPRPAPRASPRPSPRASPVPAPRKWKQKVRATLKACDIENKKSTCMSVYVMREGINVKHMSRNIPNYWPSPSLIIVLPRLVSAMDSHYRRNVPESS